MKKTFFLFLLLSFTPSWADKTDINDGDITKLNALAPNIYTGMCPEMDSDIRQLKQLADKQAHTVDGMSFHLELENAELTQSLCETRKVVSYLLLKTSKMDDKK